MERMGLGKGTGKIRRRRSHEHDLELGRNMVGKSNTRSEDVVGKAERMQETKHTLLMRYTGLDASSIEQKITELVK